jgi:hypothetical protein
MADLIEEKESFDKLIRVLEDALEAAAKILGPMPDLVFEVII